jgi:hypothetical protein
MMAGASTDTITITITISWLALGSIQLLAAKENPFFSLQGDSCVTMDYVKEKIRAKCEEDHTTTDRPIFLNCYGILLFL